MQKFGDAESRSSKGEIFGGYALQNCKCYHLAVKRRRMTVGRAVVDQCTDLVIHYRSELVDDDFCCSFDRGFKWLLIDTSLETGVVGFEEREVAVVLECLRDCEPVVCLLFDSFGLEQNEDQIRLERTAQSMSISSECRRTAQFIASLFSSRKSNNLQRRNIARNNTNQLRARRTAQDDTISSEQADQLRASLFSSGQEDRIIALLSDKFCSGASRGDAEVWGCRESRSSKGEIVGGYALQNCKCLSPCSKAHKDDSWKSCGGSVYRFSCSFLVHISVVIPHAVFKAIQHEKRVESFCGFFKEDSRKASERNQTAAQLRDSLHNLRLDQLKSSELLTSFNLAFDQK
ncbi:hypothetical protein F511_04974 [Dorcoceras hygrometricum]|uniref:Uncharacterized protein n=1 Tax=Dorcoceras hygrometricum TaxID=472368 RepID=A0A2Z7BVI0_9LAMI|nr:hypothetical protein F511_04974 [Dorcoceras hygrometricum]